MDRLFVADRRPPSRLWSPAGPCPATAVPGAGHFGERLVEAMQLRGNFKATALACALAVNEAAISRWKRGGPITLPHAVGLCDVLDISMDWLIRGVGQPGIPCEPVAAWPLPDISERTLAEVRALLQFVEHQSGSGLHRMQAAGRHAQEPLGDTAGESFHSPQRTDSMVPTHQPATRIPPCPHFPMP